MNNGGVADIIQAHWEKRVWVQKSFIAQKRAKSRKKCCCTKVQKAG